MNDQELHELLDGAARSFVPRPDAARFTALLRRPRSNRPLIFGVGAVAAGLLLTVGGAAAMTGGTSDTVVPGDLVELPTTATVPHDPVPPTSTTSTVATTTTTVATTDVPVTTVTIPESTAAPAIADETAAPEPAPTSAPADVVATTRAPAPVVPAPVETAAPATTAAPVATSAPESTAPPTTAAPTTHATTTPPTTHATTTTTVSHGFSANQTWGSCGSEPPYEELFGTAAPGTTINVSSPYGSASTTATAAGTWYVQVFFAGAPSYEEFTISVSSSQGAASFPFVVTI